MKQALIEWRDTLDAVQDLIILEDAFGNLRRCNRATIQFLDCGFEDVLGRGLHEFIRARAVGNDHLRRDRWEGELLGYPGWFEIHNNMVGSGVPDASNWVHVIKNVTQRRVAEQELSRLYSVIEHSPDSVLITDESGRIEYVNTAFERVQGGSRAAIVGKFVGEVVPTITRDQVSRDIFPYLAENAFWRNTLRVTRGYDHFFEEVTVSRIEGTPGSAVSYHFVLRDVTETRQLESIAEAVNLMENYGLVFSGIRHELGNPVNSVKMALTVLQMNHVSWSDDQVETFIQRCLLELGRVEYLLRTLKSFSVHEEPAIEPVELQRFMQNFVGFVRTDFASRGIQIELKSGPFDLVAKCDPRALHQVMMNLLANAADAVSDLANPEIVIHVAEARNTIAVVVEDNGRGMSERQIANLFKPFYTSKSDGSGLGLVIVRKMLASMGGTIEIESSPGGGTRATVFLRSGSHTGAHDR